MYWDPTDPGASLAPDAFVRLGEVDSLFRNWKVWEHGAPHVAVEIISDADERDRDWETKLEKYRRLGVTELVRFDLESSDRPLRVWDSVEYDLVERELSEPRAQSRCLPGFWVAIEQPEIGLALRLGHDEQGEHLYPTPAEREAEAHHGQRGAEQRFRSEAEARRAAEQRFRELEEELRGRP